MADLFTLLEEIAAELPGCRMTSVVELESGMQLASVRPDETPDSAGADAYTSDLYRVISEALPELNSGGDIESVVLCGASTTLVTEPLGDSGYSWHVATNGQTTLGFTQAIMRKFRQQLTDSVTDLIGG